MTARGIERPEVDRKEGAWEGALFTLCPTPPFDFLKALTYLEARVLFVDRAAVEATRLHLTLPVGDRAVRVTLEAPGDGHGCGDGDDPTLLCQAVTDTTESLDPNGRATLQATLRRFLACDDDVRPFYALARDDVPFWRLVEPLIGLHRVSFPTPFEAIAWFILRQREYTSVALARRRALTEGLGSALVVEGRTFRAFPTPDDLLATPFDTVRGLVRKRRKAVYLHHAAEAFAGQEPDFFHRAPVEEVEAWLLSVRGIGPWTARAFLANGLNRPTLTHTLARDGTLGPSWRAILARYYGAEVEPGFLAELADHYGACQGYWLYYARFMHHVLEQRAD